MTDAAGFGARAPFAATVLRRRTLLGAIRQSPALTLSIFAAAHLVLGAAMDMSSALAGLHALATYAIGCWTAMRRTRGEVAAAAAYVAAADVLWRMTEAPVPYEGAKYGVALVLGIYLLRSGRRGVWRAVPLLYFGALLFPGVLTFANPDLTARQAVMHLSFNLSGPLALCMSAWFFGQTSLDAAEFRRLRGAVLGPLMAIAAITLVATYTSPDVVFNTESNVVTAGGFGPNQVSSVLGLGVLMAALGIFDPRVSGAYRLVCGGLLLLLGMQAAMTFSRGGLYAAVIGLAVGLPFLLGNRRARRRLIIGGGLVALIAVGFVVPRLDQFTGGALGSRFSSTNSTNRGSIMMDDVNIFLANPIFGAGPGRAREHRTDAHGAAGHTEYSRLLAEHGSFGLIALLCMAVMGLNPLLRRGSHFDRGFSVALLVWASVSMLHAAMRVASFGFVFGLSQASLRLRDHATTAGSDEMGEPTSRHRHGRVAT